MSTACYNNIVGISKNGCSCIPQSGDSLSGKYLDDMNMGSIPLKQAIFDCNESDLTAFFTGLITQSVNETVMLLRKNSGEKLTKSYVDINTTIGWRDSFTSYLPITTNWQYVALKPLQIRGMYFKIDGIQILLSSGNFSGTIKIIDDRGTEVYSGLLSAFTGIKLKMDRTYYVAYQSNVAAKNINANTCCNYYATWPTYMMLGSGSVASLNDLKFNQSKDTYGIIIDGQFICDGYDFICNMDWNSDFGFVFSSTVQQVARLSLGRWLLTNGKVTNYTLITSEQLVQTLEYLQKIIDENIEWLPGQNKYSDCYTCGRTQKGEILI